jgi:hypothetical protein
MKLHFALAVALAGFPFGLLGRAQEIDLLPRELIQLGEGQLGLIDDLRVSGIGSSSSFSFTNENGVKTTKVADGTNRMTIIEDPASGITCKVTKTYGPDDLAKLEEEQPELFMHLSAIPKTVGESQIEINVGVTSTYTAADPDELKSKHPEVYKLYNKYTKEQGVDAIHMRMARPLRLRLGLDGARIDQPADDDDELGDDDDADDDRDEGDEDSDDDGR